MRVGVLGDGAWGTAIACHLDALGAPVTLWSPFPAHAEAMRAMGGNEKFLPGSRFGARTSVTADIGEAAAADLLVLALPCQHMRGLLERLRPVHVPGRHLLVNVAKGIERRTLMRVSEMAAAILGPDHRYAVLSGPSHAEEVVKAVPTAVVAASADPAAAAMVQKAFMGPSFRVYTSQDTVGVELGGALKNVYAIAAGIIDGMGLGDNPKAAMLTRAVAEMSRLGKALGGRPETFAGLSGLGDLLVTCYSRHSRNRHVGEGLGRGRPLAEVLASLGAAVAEGVDTSEGACGLAARVGVDTPVVNEIHAALRHGKDPRQCLMDLMSRSAKPEIY